LALVTSDDAGLAIAASTGSIGTASTDSDAALSRIALKYGLNQLRAVGQPGVYLSLKHEHKASMFQSFSDSLRPQVFASSRLLAELSDGAPTDRAVNHLAAICSRETPKLESDIGVEGMLGEEEVRTLSNFKHTFFQVGELNPSSVKGQAALSNMEWSPGELLVTEMALLYADKVGQNAYVWATPCDSFKDIQRLAPETQLVQHTGAWTSTAEKYYYHPSFKVEGDFQMILVAIKRLVDARDAACGANSISIQTDINQELIHALDELARRGVVECSERGQNVSTWGLADGMSDLLEPVVKLHSPKRIMNPRTDISITHMSIIDLVGHLKLTWTHKIWHPEKKSRTSTISESEPAAFVVATASPKIWWTVAGRDTVSRWYLQALASYDKLQVEEIRHLQNDSYYKQLFGGKLCLRDKKRNLLALEDDTGLHELACLLDEPPTKKKPTASDTSGLAKSAKARAKTKKLGHEKTHSWGVALITFSIKNSGVSVWQGTCHRRCGHKPVGGRTGACRKTISITDKVSEETALRRVKFWLAKAGDYATRIQHKKFQAPHSKIPDDDALEALMPPDGYASDGGDVDERMLVELCPASAPGVGSDAVDIGKRGGRGRGRASSRARGRGRPASGAESTGLPIPASLAVSSSSVIAVAVAAPVAEVAGSASSSNSSSSSSSTDSSDSD
jgi:hypothetical protein